MGRLAEFKKVDRLLMDFLENRGEFSNRVIEAFEKHLTRLTKLPKIFPDSSLFMSEPFWYGRTGR